MFIINCVVCYTGYLSCRYNYVSLAKSSLPFRRDGEGLALHQLSHSSLTPSIVLTTNHQHHSTPPSSTLPSHTGGESCTAYDVVVNTEFLTKTQESPIFHNFFFITTMELLDQKYDLNLDKNSEDSGY